MEILPH